MKFSQFIQAAERAGRLVVQPRMGFADLASMRQGLEAVSHCDALAVGTITLDSYTRVGDHASARQALSNGQHLNGFPIVAHGADATRAMLETLRNGMPIQVRHGSAQPQDIFSVLRASGADATEGGPVSYCLPYGRVPLDDAIRAWQQSCQIIAAPKGSPDAIHLESFGGCMLGQLCPPGLLIAISILEGMFFIEQGVFDLSLSYAQQTNQDQDIAALKVLRQLARRFLGQADWHIVLYTYMGVFPRTYGGAQDLLAQSVRLAFHGHAQRLIVKTTAEAHRIPTVAENIQALEFASQTWDQQRAASSQFDCQDSLQAEIHNEALALIDAVLNSGPDLGSALAAAFSKGYLDIPFCLHANNLGKSRSYIDPEGLLRWHATGAMPIKPRPVSGGSLKLNPYEFLNMLSFVESRFDQTHLPTDSAAVQAPTAPKDAKRIVIVGSGPRAIAILERLALELEEHPPSAALNITVVDAVEPGAGRVWRTDQSPLLLMNTITSQITLYSGPLQQGPWRPGAGPTLHQWLQLHSDEQLSRLGPNGYAPRQAYGQYLRSCFSVIVASLEQHATVSVLKNEVTAMELEPEGLRLRLADGTQWAGVDSVILATGHAKVPQPAATSQNPGCRYIAGDCAADMPLGQISAGQTVAIIGMGLGFYDLLGELTVGRGGQFVHTEGGLKYLPSGHEPRIVAGTRSGMPILARATNQKPAGTTYQATFMTARAIERARVQTEKATGSRALAFNAEVLPLIQAEMDQVYYATALRNRRGDAAAERFVLDHAREREPSKPIAAALLKAYELTDLPPLDLQQLARPFGRRMFDSHEAFERELIELLLQDVVEASKGNLHSPVKAALDVLRDVRDTIRQTVEFDGLTADSRTQDFLGDFAPACALVSAGPPLFRTQQLLALLDAAVITVMGPHVSFDPHEHGEGYQVHCAQVPGYRRHADWLIDSRMRTPLVETDGSPLFKQLMRDGYITPHRHSATADVGEGLATDRQTFAVLDASGKTLPGVWAIGIPTEGARWFTQVGSATPGVLSRFTKDATSVARQALAHVWTTQSSTTNQFSLEKSL